MITRPASVVLGLVLAFGTVSAAHSDDYKAMSNTAESITGDISMDDSGITFANGESLSFSALLGDHFIVDGERIAASVYSVGNPSDPELENGNQLCGSGDVTYVAAWTAGEGMTTVAVFTGNNPPRNSGAMCASYTYED